MGNCFNEANTTKCLNKQSLTFLKSSLSPKKHFSLLSNDITPKNLQNHTFSRESLRKSKSFNNNLILPSSFTHMTFNCRHNEIKLNDFLILKEFDHDKVYKGKRYLVSKKSNPKLLFTMTNCKKNFLNKEINELYNIQKQLFELNCPFLSKVQYLVENKDNVYIFQEYYSGLDLSFQLSRFGYFKEKIVRFYICEAIVAFENLPYNITLLQSMRSCLDMKSLLLDRDGHLTINIVSQILRATKKLGSTPDERYQPPEVIRNLIEDNLSFSAAFAWKLGVFLYEMLFGVKPFENAEQILNKTINININVYVSAVTVDLIHQLLIPNHLKRLGSSNLSEVKKHEFFQDVNWNEFLEKKMIGPLALSSKDESFIFEHHNHYCEPTLHGKEEIEEDLQNSMKRNTNDKSSSLLSDVSEENDDEVKLEF